MSLNNSQDNPSREWITWAAVLAAVALAALTVYWIPSSAPFASGGLSMPFVVMATGRTRTVSWLSVANGGGIRTLTTREDADVFRTVAEAHAAIAQLPRGLENAGLVFSVRDGRPIAPRE